MHKTEIFYPQKYKINPNIITEEEAKSFIGIKYKVFESSIQSIITKNEKRFDISKHNFKFIFTLFLTFFQTFWFLYRKMYLYAFLNTFFLNFIFLSIEYIFSTNKTKYLAIGVYSTISLSSKIIYNYFTISKIKSIKNFLLKYDYNFYSKEEYLEYLSKKGGTLKPFQFIFIIIFYFLTIFILTFSIFLSSYLEL